MQRGIDYDVKGLRERLGLTQQELAQQVGVAISSVARWESGHKVSKLAYRRLQDLERDAGRTAKKEAA